MDVSESGKPEVVGLAWELLGLRDVESHCLLVQKEIPSVR